MGLAGNGEGSAAGDARVGEGTARPRRKGGDATRARMRCHEVALVSLNLAAAPVAAPGSGRRPHNARRAAAAAVHQHPSPGLPRQATGCCLALALTLPRKPLLSFCSSASTGCEGTSRVAMPAAVLGAGWWCGCWGALATDRCARYGRGRRPPPNTCAPRHSGAAQRGAGGCGRWGCLAALSSHGFTEGVCRWEGQ